MLEILVIPACFLGAALIGYRLGTPPRVAGGLAAVGCTHLLAFLGADQALSAGGVAADWIHLVSQWLFSTGFAAFVWLAATYPTQRPSTRLVAVAAALAVAGPALAAISGPTPSILDDQRELGPILHVLPASAASIVAVPLMLLPVLAVITFVARYRRATAHDRAAMRWPIAGLAFIAVLVIAGTTLGSERQGVVTALFLLGAPAFPLALAFGPVLRRLDGLSAELADTRERVRTRPAVPPGLLGRLSPREVTVLESMAEGMANPVIAKTMHLSLSSVEKHATSIFRKLEIPEGPAVHRRVAAVVAYRDAIETTEQRPETT
ncbi:MAG: LuxR C-terminal-related transcriptional regulator [Nocardioides sp.]